MTHKTGADLINEAKSRITELSPKDAVGVHQRGDALFIDVREPNEWNLGHIPGAVHIPRGLLEGKVEGVADRAKQVVLYCASGNRSALAAETLQHMGYQHVTSLSGGFQGWAAAGGDIED